MSRVVIIGGSGHVGGYLVPRLVEAGNQVVNVTRGQHMRYRDHSAWTSVENVTLDRDAEEKSGTFGTKIADLKPDVVIDKICFTLESAQQLVEALEGRVSHFLHTGTIWVHGHSLTVPTHESDARMPFGDYGTQKSVIEDYLLDRARRKGFPATVVRPGHIVGPGWNPLNPAGHFNNEAFSTIARGEELSLPNFGLETVHHVHADDVAQVFLNAMSNWGASVGEAFNAVSAGAVTLRGYAEAIFAWYGHQPNLRFEPFAEWAEGQSPEDAGATWEHIARSPCHSIEKGQRLLGYAPRYSSLAAVQESVSWLIGQGQVEGRK
jgi:nucleoside-diphosphate-sugar epimerase